MKWLVLAAGLLACGTATAREPLAKPMARTPSIMVDDGASTRSKPRLRQQTRRPEARRPARREATRARRVVVPRLSTTFESDTQTLNRSISQQQQLLQSQQRQQIDNNLLRQDIQRSTTTPIGTPPIGCSPGSIGC